MLCLSIQGIPWTHGTGASAPTNEAPFRWLFSRLLHYKILSVSIQFLLLLVVESFPRLNSHSPCPVLYVSTIASRPHKGSHQFGLVHYPLPGTDGTWSTSSPSKLDLVPSNPAPFDSSVRHEAHCLDRWQGLSIRSTTALVLDYYGQPVSAESLYQYISLSALTLPRREQACCLHMHLAIFFILYSSTSLSTRCSSRSDKHGRLHAHP